MEWKVGRSRVFAATGGRPPDPARPWLLLVHGAANDRTVWQLPARYFAHHGYSVLAVDLPGHGGSGGAPLRSIEAMAEWVRRLLDSVGAASASLAGHSMGALIAMAAAAKIPDRVDALALLGVAPRIPVHPDLLAAAERDDPLAFELIVSWGLAHRSQLGGHRAPGVWMTGGGLRLLERAAPGVFAADLRACGAFDGAEAMAAAIACPTLFVLGGRDRLTPPKAAGALAALFRDARTVTLEGCGHMMLAERPDETLDALRTIFR